MLSNNRWIGPSADDAIAAHRNTNYTQLFWLSGVANMTLISADLRGKTALVTGGASGIGKATALLFARSGATVAINDLAENPRLEETIEAAREEGLSIIAVAGDLAERDAADTVVGAAVKEMGRLDYLINNAATAATPAPIPSHDLASLTDERWDRILNLNLVAPFRCSRAAAAALKATRGAIVNTASAAAFSASGSSAIYAASKAGLVNLTKHLAVGLSPEVRVNAVAPGFITTPWSKKFGPEWEAKAVEASALKRAGTAAEIADVMLFLCAGATYITGQTILVDGGCV